MTTPHLPRVEIQYCIRCNFQLRAAWIAQELLTTFAMELGEVALVPGRDGIFELRVDGELFYSYKREGDFPQIKEIKHRLRDRIAPGKNVGHGESG